MPTWAENRKIRELEAAIGDDILGPKERVRGLGGRGYSEAEERAVHRSAGTDDPPARKRREDD